MQLNPNTRTSQEDEDYYFMLDEGICKSYITSNGRCGFISLKNITCSLFFYSLLFTVLKMLSYGFSSDWLLSLVSQQGTKFIDGWTKPLHYTFLLSCSIIESNIMPYLPTLNIFANNYKNRSEIDAIDKRTFRGTI